jgi:formate-dependent nitrite reductase membrane component NrfD
MGVELTITHPTKDAKEVVTMILKGRYKSLFWLGAIIVGNILPLLLFLGAADSGVLTAIAGVLTLIGVYINNHIWVEAPQRIALS